MIRNGLWEAAHCLWDPGFAGDTGGGSKDLKSLFRLSFDKVKGTLKGKGADRIRPGPIRDCL